MDNSTLQIDDPGAEVNVGPLQGESFRDSQPCSSAQENDCMRWILKLPENSWSSKGMGAGTPTKFLRIKYVRSLHALGTLSHKADRIPMQPFLATGVRKDDVMTFLTFALVGFASKSPRNQLSISTVLTSESL